MTKLIMGIGVSGAGKTTVLKSFAQKNNYVYLCPDNIREELTGDSLDQSQNKEVWELARRRLAELLQSGQTVVFDATFVDSRIRKDFLSFARQIGVEKIQGVWLDIPREVSQERNQSRQRVMPDYAIDRQYAQIEQSIPQLDDGFDDIFRLDQDQNLVEAVVRTDESDLHRRFDG